MQKESVERYPRAGLSDAGSACALADDWLVSRCPADMGDPFAFDGIEERNMRLKAVSEITLLSTLTGGVADRGLAVLARRWLEDGVLRRKALSAIRHAPQRAHLVMPFLNAQLQAGLLGAAETNDLQGLFNLFEARLLNELVPYRAIDFWYLVWKISGQQSQLERFMPIASVGCLAEDTSAWHIDDRRAYAITHTIFYLTDFGARAWPAALCSIGFLDRLLDALSLRAEIEGNCDLLAEYLLSRRCLGTATPRMAEEIDFLLSEQHETGLWPAPVEKNTLDRHVNPEKFFEHYHTTLMARVALSGVDPMRVQRRLGQATPAPLCKRLTVPADFFETPGFAEIYNAYRTMITDGDDARGPGRRRVDQNILLAGIAHPRTCVHMITHAFWASRTEGLDGELRGLILPILEVEEETVIGNRGLFRIWALVFSMCPEERDGVAAGRLLDALAPQTRDAAWWKTGVQDRLDTLAGLLILESSLGGTKHEGALAAVVRDELNYAMCSGDVGALVTLLPFIGEISVDEGVLDEAAAYFVSMLPESQCFGWLGDGRYGESRMVAEDLQLQAAQVFLSRRIRECLEWHGG